MNNDINVGRDDTRSNDLKYAGISKQDEDTKSLTDEYEYLNPRNTKKRKFQD